LAISAAPSVQGNDVLIKTEMTAEKQSMKQIYPRLETAAESSIEVLLLLEARCS
jgi:hypothetical protein